MNANNFGLGNRDIARAMLNAYKSLGSSFASVQAAKSAYNAFRAFLKDNGIKDLKDVEKTHVERFSGYLEGKSASTIQNYLSFVNQAMSVARLDDKCHVNAVRDLGVENRTGINTEDKSISSVQHEQWKSEVGDRLGAQLDLQREFGLRFKESCLINASKSYQEALEKGSVTISEGTKGGRDRNVPITSEKQLETLLRASEIQGKHHSMIPSHLSFKEYKQEAYSNNIQFHAERHTYANERYIQLTGCLSPVRAGIERSERFEYIASSLNVSVEQAKEIDHEARMTIANELGHGREFVTNQYLG